MRLIVGLGNPGRLYTDSRHNIGFSVVRALAKAAGVSLKKEKYIPAVSAAAQIERHKAVLALPMTFMNLSGCAVRQLLDKYAVDAGGLLVVCDDLDLEFGRIKLRASGSSGGHRGLASIIASAGTQDFSRLRIGIGRPPGGREAADFVLSPFLKKEKAQLQDVISRAVECCGVWAAKGAAEAMNTYNKRST